MPRIYTDPFRGEFQRLSCSLDFLAQVVFMRFDQAIRELSNEIEKKTDSTIVVDVIKSVLNFAKMEVAKYALWSHLEVPNNELIVVPDYTTGTAAVINNSQTVTIAGGGVVTSDMVGRYFQENLSTAQYEISSVDTAANTLTLKSKYLDPTDTGKYTISKRYYRLPTDVWIILPNQRTRNLRNDVQISGYDDYASDYKKGTMTLTVGSRTLTGFGTEFMANVFPGDIIEAKSQIYRVRTVLSDTTITMVNHAKENYPAGQYKIYSDTPYKGILTGIVPSSVKTLLNYSYIRSLYPMVSDDDDTELPPQFDRVIKDIAKAEWKRTSGHEAADWSVDISLSQRRLQKLEMNNDLVLRSSQTFGFSFPVGMGRGQSRAFRSVNR